MNVKKKHAKKILRKYGRHLKASEKSQGSLLSNWKCFWSDVKDLEKIAGGN